jgi:uncharacterized protein YeaO (DUF488 family)
MLLQSKSIQAKKTSRDGIRVCVMRRVKPEYDFDLWLPHVAPSERLLQKYVIDQKITWEQFKPRFLRQLKKNKKYLDLLIELSKTYTVTLLCWEETPEYCHRRLVVEECLKISPSIKIKLA